jgi:anthranilate phosphoribosyltransferase
MHRRQRRVSSIALWVSEAAAANLVKGQHSDRRWNLPMNASAPDAIRHAVEGARAGQDLTSEAMEAAVGGMLRGEVPDQAIGELLMALRAKGESVSELVGAARALRRQMLPIHHRFTVLLDTCGTGGDGSGTFNISTATAIVVAAAGIAVAKHGNRRITSRTGSADALAALGVDVDLPRERVEELLSEIGLCFCFAPRMHPAMARVAEVRRQLAVPTLFNFLGPLCNPAGATHQLLGTGHPALLEKLSAALCQLGSTHSLVVRGSDGLDELTLAGETEVREIDAGRISSQRWQPEQFGIARHELSGLQVDGPEASAAMIRDVLAGKPGPSRDIVVLNAAAALWLVGAAPDRPMAARLAEKTIDSGAARDKLEQLGHSSRRANRPAT